MQRIIAHLSVLFFGILLGYFFFNGKETTVERIKYVPISVRVDTASIERVQAIRDSVKFSELGKKFPKQILRTKFVHDTTYLYDASRFIQTHTLDTSANVPVKVSIRENGEGRDTFTTANIQIHSSFIGSPINEFWNTSVRIAPLSFSVPVKEKTIVHEESGNFWLQLHAGNVAGVGIGYSKVGIGTLFSVDSVPIYFISYRFGH